MYAFLVVITVLLPATKPIKNLPNKFTIRIHDTGQYEPGVCHKKAEEMAERVKNYARRRMPFAIIQTELGCSLIETRPI